MGISGSEKFNKSTIMILHNQPWRFENEDIYRDVEQGREGLKQITSKGKHTISDYEYKPCGVCNIFLACEPLTGKRMVKITERKTKKD